MSGQIKDISTDYAEMGFRDCISEVSQLFLEIEGIQVQSPFRLRLLSHLKCFSEQKSTEMRVNQAFSFHDPCLLLQGQFKINFQVLKNIFNFN